MTIDLINLLDDLKQGILTSSWYLEYQNAFDLVQKTPDVYSLYVEYTLLKAKYSDDNTPQNKENLLSSLEALNQQEYGRALLEAKRIYNYEINKLVNIINKGLSSE
jgi:cell fate (sporulation/competence/biofilm development) regulator YlbF (YheA/YmcA/DUF963 family)